MASKKVEILDNWTLLNKGGELDSDGVIGQINDGEAIFFCVVTNEDDEKLESNSFTMFDSFIYTGNEYLYVKAYRKPLNIVIDKI